MPATQKKKKKKKLGERSSGASRSGALVVIISVQRHTNLRIREKLADLREGSKLNRDAYATGVAMSSVLAWNSDST
jgi:hypothetical protein